MAFNDVRTKKVAGNIPDYGAIFMSNQSTKEECLDRNLFGLPLAFADFVKNVKAGMILFLFEHENRELYGVFQATSDGALNIVPCAYTSSGKLFPAQVQFNIIWNCHPLSECVFRAAIEDNYYSTYKFKFGLSKEQVHKLLWLFDVKRIRVQRSLTEMEMKKKCDRSLVQVNPLVDYGKLELEGSDSTIENQPGSSTSVPDSLDPESSSLLKSLRIPSSHSETEQLHISSDLGDYIPLSSPGLSDTWESSLRNPSSHSKTEQLHISSDLGDYIPLSSPGQSDTWESSSDSSEGTGNLEKDNCPEVRGLYADKASSRTSVFSRLQLVSGDDDTTNQLSMESVVEDTVESVHEIMEKLVHRHEGWKGATEAGDVSLNKKASVFSRLNFASKADVQREKHHIKRDRQFEQVKQEFQRNKIEERAGFFIRNVERNGGMSDETGEEQWEKKRKLDQPLRRNEPS